MLYIAKGKPAHLGCKFLLDVSVVNSPIAVELLVITAFFCVVLPAGSTTQNKTVITNNSTTIGLFTTDTSNKNLNLSEPPYLWPYTAYVLLMMGEIVARNM